MTIPDPIFIPKIIAKDCAKVMTPACIKLTTKTVTAVALCSIIVDSAPTPKPLNLFLDNFCNFCFKLLPAKACIDLLINLTASKKVPNPAINVSIL